MICLINFLLFFIRIARLNFTGFYPCIVNGKEVDMWDLKPGDVFTIKTESEKRVVIGWPTVCWLHGKWGVYTLSEDEYPDYLIQQSSKETFT